MNSESFDIQSIYAMKNVYFICFWSEAANIFVYKIFLRKQINAKGGCKKRRPKQFSVQRRSSGPACATKSWFYSGRIRETKSLASSFSDDRILLIFCHQIWSVRFEFCIERKRRRKNAPTLRNSAVSRRFSLRASHLCDMKYSNFVFECSHMCILFQPSELITWKSDAVIVVKLPNYNCI